MRNLLIRRASRPTFAPAALALPRAMHPTLGATLAGKNEVPKGSPTAHGIVNLNLKAGAGQVCWTFQLAGVAKPLAAHIHKGRPGVSGPVFIALGKAFKAKGCASAPKKAIEAVETNPNAFYVNVHNAKYPAGIVRGTLVAGMVHM